MKNYLYLAALCCTLSSCDSWGSKDETIVEDPSKGFFTKTTFCLPWDAIDDKADNITTEIIGQIPDWFEMQYPAYTATSMSVIPEGTPGAGLYIFYEEKNVPDDSDEFLIDPSASLAAKLPAIKAGQKPTSGGGIFYNTDDVWIRYYLKNGWFTPEVLELSPDTNTHKKETVRSYEELKISSPQKKSGATASLTLKQHVFHRDTADGFVRESYIGEDDFIHWNEYSLPGYNEELK